HAGAQCLGRRGVRRRVHPSRPGSGHGRARQHPLGAAGGPRLGMMPAMPAAFTLLPGALKGVRAVVGDTARSLARHTHDEFGIGLIDRGAQRSASGRGPVEAWAGDVITVNPGEVHDGAALTPAGRRWRMLYLDVGVLRAWADDMGADGVRLAAEFTQPVLRDARLAAGFRQAF